MLASQDNPFEWTWKETNVLNASKITLQGTAGPTQSHLVSENAISVGAITLKIVSPDPKDKTTEVAVNKIQMDDEDL
jgi:hypothetical protein